MNQVAINNVLLLIFHFSGPSILFARVMTVCKYLDLLYCFDSDQTDCSVALVVEAVREMDFHL